MTIRCPHCEEAGCDGRCRFRVGRRGFLGLALGAAAAALLPAPPMSFGVKVWSHWEAHLVGAENIVAITPSLFTGTMLFTDMPRLEVDQEWSVLCARRAEALKDLERATYTQSWKQRNPQAFR